MILWIGWLAALCAAVSAGIVGYWAGRSALARARPSSRWIVGLAVAGAVLIAGCVGYSIGVAGHDRSWVVVLLVLAVILEVSIGLYAVGSHGAARHPPQWLRWTASSAAVAAGLLGAFCGGYWLAPGATAGASTSEAAAHPTLSASGNAPVVPVQTVPIRLGTIQETITAYGRVMAQPGATSVLSVPFQATVQNILVTAGEEVDAGTQLITIAPSPAARTQLLQAQQALRTAQEVLKQVEQEYQQHLAVNTQLDNAKQGYRSARLQLDRLKKEGVAQTTTLTASSPGIVSGVDVHLGQMIAAGTPLLEVALGDRIEARLGLEPEDIPNVHSGEAVELTPVHLDPGRPVTGQVRLVAHEVNPATALVEVFVSLPPHSGLTLFAYVRGILTTQARRALIVPTEAVLPNKSGYTLFTVHNGRAVRHVGLETDTEVQIDGDGVMVGEPAVLAGNYELTPGMAVSSQARR